MSSPISSPPTSRTLRSLSSCHVGFEIPTCGLSDSLTRFGSLRSGWSLITLLPFTSLPLICYSTRIHRAVRLPTHICSSPSLEKPMKEIRNFQLDCYAEISKCLEGASYELRLYGVLRSSHPSLRTPLLSLRVTSRRAW